MPLVASDPPLVSRLVVRMLSLLQREVMMTMALCGVTTVSELEPSMVTRAEVVTSPGALSAFPLLDEGY